ncbi:GNAT family N-acetyltransferase [Rhizobium sp. S95]|uniref:GNAT family N-acetyltransferase n=1 Tax=Ciceribacter sichuanensis TaxID=2949647 RepID=A0AAJ1F8J3_9HYPH|nr:MULTISPECIES: GNAT family N-acetyltransferase [unclassified Ciceribacter]MCM2396760.1 GNAT family N-acetyltransferase [Ciceribacter sp. S95]MCO5958148.1 GNAT family N-acetyltransferase [Ciceribacter sp. S101]
MITTERLVLRRPELRDFEAYATMWSHPEVLRHISTEPFSEEMIWGRFLRQAGGWLYMGFGYFVMEEKESGQFVGQIGFQDLHRDLTPSLIGTMEAGWTLHPTAHGKGYASEAAAAVFQWAEENFSGQRITCIIAPENIPSLKIAAKMRMHEFARSTYHGKPVIMMERHL